MTDGLPFTKMQGIGNDFVLVEAGERPGAAWSGLAPVLCDRHFGVGGDGLLVVGPEPEGAVRMWMYNPDGTEDFCGNGLRCVARYAFDRGWGHGNAVRISTIRGSRTAEMLSTGGDQVRVDMESPRFDPEHIPMRLDGEQPIDYELPLSVGTLRITALSTGSTHAVTFVDSLPEDDEFYRISPEVERHPRFPERTSLMWAKVDGRDRLSLRIWERGVGETLGCGTGACAAMVAARIRGDVGPEATVASRGGELLVSWNPGSPLLQTGPAQYIFRGMHGS